MPNVERVKNGFMHFLWGRSTVELPWWEGAVVRALRIIYVIAANFVNGEITLRAMSLVYTTLLSLVPLIAVSFSVLKGFGVHNEIEPLLRNFFAPLGPQGDVVTDRLIGFVDNVKAGVLGTVSLGFLIYTVISLLQKIEETYNHIWHVSQSRSLGKRFTHYMSVLMVGPLLMISAVALTATLMSTSFIQTVTSYEPFGTLVKAVTGLVPYLMVIAAFTFTYVFIPNTHVRLSAALTGGVIAGALWQTAGWLFAQFVATSTNYTAIYSGLAIVLVFMIWLYIAWQILLIGASIAFYQQHPEYLIADQQPDRHLSGRMREKAALALMYWVGRDFEAQAPAHWGCLRLARQLHLPVPGVRGLTERLVRDGLLLESGGHATTFYVPARPLEKITLAEIIASARTQGEKRYSNYASMPAEGPVDDLIERLDRARAEVLAGATLKDMVAVHAAADPSARTPDGSAAPVGGRAPEKPAGGSPPAKPEDAGGPDSTLGPRAPGGRPAGQPV